MSYGAGIERTVYPRSDFRSEHSRPYRADPAGPNLRPGDTATGGGFVLEPPVQAQSAQKDLGDGWFVYAWNPGDTPKKAHATVTCTWIDY